MKKIPFLPDRYYLIKNRANNDELLFRQNRDYRLFLHLFEVHVSQIAELEAYNLVNRSFELLIRIRPDSELPDKYRQRLHLPISNMFNAYAKRVNCLYKRTGSLFREHFSREEIPVHELEKVSSQIKNKPISQGGARTLRKIAKI